MENQTNEKATSRIDQVKSYEDARRVLGKEPLTIDAFSALDEDERVRAFAHHKLENIAAALNMNEDGTPHVFDWNNTDEYKYFPWFDMETYEGQAPGSGFAFNGVGYDNDCTDLGARLHYRTREHAKYAGTQFIEIYREWIRG